MFKDFGQAKVKLCSCKSNRDLPVIFHESNDVNSITSPKPAEYQPGYHPYFPAQPKCGSFRV